MPWPESVDRTQLRVEFFRGSGKGGQNRNKRDTACRITHIPTGLFSTAEEHKSQLMNRNAAFNRLAKQLVPIMKSKLDSHTDEFTSNERVRSYNEKRDEVIDHRTGITKPYKQTLDGDLDAFVLGLKK